MEDTEDRSERLARLCAQVLDETKMEGIRILRVDGVLQITDYFVVASGRSPRHVKAASDEVMKHLREAGAVRRGLEGHREGKWVLIDFSDVVVHLFVEESRQFYDLENLWGDCPRLEWAVFSPRSSPEFSPRSSPEFPPRSSPEFPPRANPEVAPRPSPELPRSSLELPAVHTSAGSS